MPGNLGDHCTDGSKNLLHRLARCARPNMRMAGEGEGEGEGEAEGERERKCIGKCMCVSAVSIEYEFA